MHASRAALCVLSATAALLASLLTATAAGPATTAEWQAAVQARVTAALMVPSATPKRRPVVTFEVARDGSLIRAEVSESSGEPAVDAAVLRAVRRAAPLPALPADISGASETVRMPFDFDLGPSQPPATPVPTETAVRDPKTGLTVDLQVPFSAELGRPPRGYDAVINVETLLGDPPTVNADGALCSVAFVSVPEYAGLSQDEIDARLSDPAFVNEAGKPFTAIGPLVSTEQFNADGRAGLEFTIAPTPSPDRVSTRMHISFWETPRGRFVISCATDADDWPRALAAFRTIRAGVSLSP